MMIHWTPSRHGIRIIAQADPALDIRGNQTGLAERMKIPLEQRDSSVCDLSRVSYGVPNDANWTVYLDPAIFDFFNAEFSERWSTFGHADEGLRGGQGSSVRFATL